MPWDPDLPLSGFTGPDAAPPADRPGDTGRSGPDGGADDSAEDLSAGAAGRATATAPPASAAPDTPPPSAVPIPPRGGATPAGATKRVTAAEASGATRTLRTVSGAAAAQAERDMERGLRIAGFGARIVVYPPLFAAAAMHPLGEALLTGIVVGDVLATAALAGLGWRGAPARLWFGEALVLAIVVALTLLLGGDLGLFADPAWQRAAWIGAAGGAYARWQKHQRGERFA